MQTSIAVVGSGLTGIYILAGLFKSADRLRIVIYEGGDIVCVGMPYGADISNHSGLTNIARIEITPLGRSYTEWSGALPEARLSFFPLTRDDLQERLFTPRLSLGEYLHSQLLQLAERAWAKCRQVEFIDVTEITDI